MNTLSPEPILQMLGAHMASKYLMVASELDLFAALGDEALTLEQLSEKTDVPTRTLRIVTDALSSTGFLARDNGYYLNTPVTAAFLSGQTPMDLRPVLHMWDKVVYEKWMTLETAVREDRRTFGLPEFNNGQHEIFNAGVATLTAPTAKALAETYDFSQHQCLLDLAGGLGLFITFALQKDANLKATLLELPETLAMAEKRLSATPFADRINYEEGDILTAAIPTGYDVAILANIIHVLSPENNIALLKRIRPAMQPTNRLLLVDFWTDDSKMEPKFAALMAGEFQIYSGEGDVYSVTEVGEWLDATGWKLVEHKSLGGAASLIIAEAV